MPFSSLPDRVPCELHKQSLSDIKDDRQNQTQFLQGILFHSPSFREIKKCSCQITFITPTLVANYGLKQFSWHLSKNGSIGNVIQECSLAQWILNFMNLVSIFMPVSLSLMSCSWENLPP